MRKRSGRPPRFAQVPNETVDDSLNLDLTALGLLTVFLRHKDGFDITLAKVGEKYGYGEDAMANAMGMLQIARYVVKVRIMGAGNKWRTEMAVYAPPARDAEVEELLAVIREEDPDVRRVEVIPPTATAIKRVQKRREKLGRTADSPTPGIPRVGPDSGFSRDPENPRVSKKTVIKKEDEEDETAVADAVGQSAGGFASAGATDSAAGETGEAGSGSAASTPIPTQRTTSPRPATTKTKPRRQPAGFDLVRAAIPAAVAAPGTRLYPGLHRSINDLLGGNAAAGIPSRTPEQVIARINRRWYGEKADVRSAADYRGCDRCTASGCTAARRSLETPDGCDRIINRNSWLAQAIIAQDCPDPSCEDGQIIGGGSCRNCAERRDEAQEAARAVAEAAARLEDETRSLAASRAAVDAWEAEEAAEENRLRTALGQSGMFGDLLDHRVSQHMNGWREHHPRPTHREATNR